MPKPLETTIKPTAEEGDTTQGEETSQLNSPTLDEKTGKPTKAAVSSFKQAHGISKRQYDKAKEGRLKTAAVIAEKYGGAAPYNMADLKKTGQTWRNNFSTNPLGGVVDRSTPQLTDPVEQAEYLTYSALPAERENAAEKTRKFRLRTTKLVRSWSGFSSMMTQIAQEDYLYGNAVPAHIDDDWRPKAFRFDEAFLPEGTGQHASQVQFATFRQPMLLHDFLQKIEEKDIAEAAGYNFEGCIKAANEAAGLRSDSDASQLEQTDAMRESGTVGYTYEGETKIVWLFHLLVREYGGGVNLWTTAQKGGHGIRFVKGIHETMEDALTLFTLQEGNMKFYGSKGAGRLLTNLHIAIDRGRNLAQDQVYLSGLPIISADEKDFNRIQPVVRHPFILIPKTATVAKESVGFEYQGYQYMDSNLTGIMNEIAGAFIPPHTESDQSGATTKIEAAQKAQRELAVKNGVLGRFFKQFANLMSSIQRKVYKPENLKEGLRLFEENKAKTAKGLRVIAARIFKWLSSVLPGMDKKAAPEEESAVADADAVQCIVDLLNDGLSIEDIAELALCPAGNNVEEQPEEQDAKTSGFIAGIQGTPMSQFFDGKKMAQMAAQIAVGEDRANRLLLPDQEDPNVEAVATRQQIQEWLAMQAGEQMDVASTDIHPIHRKVLFTRLEPIVKTLASAPTQELSEFAKLAIQHFADHVAADQNLDPAAKAEAEQSYKAMQQVVNQADKNLEDLAKQAQEAGVQGGAAALPPQVNGQPIQATGSDGALAGTEGDLERERLLAETQLRVNDQDIAHRKLDIEEAKLRSQEEGKAIEHALETMRQTADKTGEAIKAGIADGAADLERQAAEQNPNPPSI